LTVVDGQCFAARIDAHSERARIDWRADYDSLSYTPIRRVARGNRTPGPPRIRT
jgi:hypothetical protein